MQSASCPQYLHKLFKTFIVWRIKTMVNQLTFWFSLSQLVAMARFKAIFQDISEKYSESFDCDRPAGLTFFFLLWQASSSYNFLGVRHKIRRVCTWFPGSNGDFLFSSLKYGQYLAFHCRSHYFVAFQKSTGFSGLPWH